jgi:hypothetical protein
MNDNETYTLTLDDDVTINLDSISSNTGTYSLDSSTVSLSDITISATDFPASTITIDGSPQWTTNNSTYSYANVLDNMIDPEEVDLMCKEYPALSKVWRNFKSVYDMTLQDYKGKKEQDEI